MATSSFPGTAPWLRSQWSNPSDIFTILLIIGGEVIHVAIAQLCAGPIPYLTPVVFSFGWVSYAISALLSAVGENRLMPKPEIACCVINAATGYRRDNCSWVLNRILRDFEFWRDKRVESEETKKLVELRKQREQRGMPQLNEEKKKEPKREKPREEEEKKKEPKRKKPREEEDVRIGLRVSVWKMPKGDKTCVRADGKPKGDKTYWSGIFVALIQLGIAAIPWGLYGEWLSFLVTAAGTLLAFASGALPQWGKEKFGVRHMKGNNKKDVFLTRGNGDHDALLIRGCKGGMDLEALASPYRDLGAGHVTRFVSLLLGACWVVLLITVAGYQQHSWYLVGVGILGIVHNVGVAGKARKPSAFGIDLTLDVTHNGTYVEEKVMAVLWALERDYPNAGASLVDEFFPGKLFPREVMLWDYAKRRCDEYKDERKRYKREKAVNHPHPKKPTLAQTWPGLRRPEGALDDNDIPQLGV